MNSTGGITVNRVPRLNVVTLAVMALICGQLAAPQPCAAQQGSSTAAVTGKVIASKLATPFSQDTDTSTDPTHGQATVATGTPQSSAASITGRVQTFTRYGPVRESWTTINLGTKYVKGVLGGLEQGATIGLGVQFTTANLLRSVEFRATAISSLKLYRRFLGEVYIPKLFNENTHANLWFDYLRRTKDNFFGIGPNTPTSSMTNFDIERRSYNTSLYHNFNHEIVVGGYASLADSATYRGQRTSDVPIDQLFSGDPNTVPVSNWAPGLKTNTKILSYGGFAEFDYRDDSNGLTQGAFFYGRIGSAQGLKYTTVFSDYKWLDGEFDARGYIPLFSHKTSLALRAYAMLREPRGDSQIPFYDLAFLGGRMYGRGFRDYRFRGNHMALGSVELRQTVWTQHEHRGLDLFGSADAGPVWVDNRSYTDPEIRAN